MSQTSNGAGRVLQPIEEVRGTLRKMEGEFKAALPSHISPEKFQRVAVTAIQQNPDLLRADRKSLYGACMRAAQDGLLPDGREAALVTFGSQVQYMPMYAGILKKARNSGEIASIVAHVAYEHDTFDYELGDEERILHRPLLKGDRGEPVIVYAIATLKDGTKVREIMTYRDVEKVRAVSRSARKGPWVDWWEEMAKKTVIRRLSKRLPASTDREEEFHRTVEADDALYDFDRETGEVIEPAPQPAPSRRPKRLQQAVDAARPQPEVIDVEPEPEPDPDLGHDPGPIEEPESGPADAELFG